MRSNTDKLWAINQWVGDYMRFVFVRGCSPCGGTYGNQTATGRQPRAILQTVKNAQLSQCLVSDDEEGATCATDFSNRGGGPAGTRTQDQRIMLTGYGFRRPFRVCGLDYTFPLQAGRLVSTPSPSRGLARDWQVRKDRTGAFPEFDQFYLQPESTWPQATHISDSVRFLKLRLGAESQVLCSNQLSYRPTARIVFDLAALEYIH